MGGTFENDEPKQPQTEDAAKLSTVTLKWIVDGALDSGLLLKDGAYAQHVTLSPAHAQGTVHRMGRVWALLTYRRRRVPDGARVHDTVRLRIESDAAYGKRIPAGVGWADKEWLSPHPGAR